MEKVFIVVNRSHITDRYMENELIYEQRVGQGVVGVFSTYEKAKECLNEWKEVYAVFISEWEKTNTIRIYENHFEVWKEWDYENNNIELEIEEYEIK